MAVTPDSVTVPGTSEKLDTVTVTTSEGAVHRESVVLAHPENPDVFALPTVRGNLPVELADTAQTDAFGRLRVSSVAPIFDSIQRYGDDLLKWETATVGTGSSTASLADSGVILSTGGTSSGASCIRQTRRCFRCQPGKSFVVEMTFCMGAATTNSSVEIGLFDANNGVFLRRDGSALSFVRRSDVSGSVVSTSVAQASWNRDTLDGSGPSGVTIDHTKAQILFIDLQYLGVGRVRTGFVVDGIPIVAHEFLHANTITTMYMRTAVLPIRYAVYNTGTSSGVTTLLHLCATAYTEGGINGGMVYEFTHNNGVTPIAVTTRRPVLSIRAKTTGPGGVRNTGSLLPKNYNVSPATNDCLYEVVIGGTLTGASWSSVNASYSLAEKDISATAISGGIIVASGYATAGGVSLRGGIDKDAAHDLALAYTSLGNVQDILSIVCTAVSGTSNVLSAVDWEEAGI